MPEVGIREWHPTSAVSSKTCCLKPQRESGLAGTVVPVWSLEHPRDPSMGRGAADTRGWCLRHTLGAGCRAGGPRRDWLGSQGAGSVAEGTVAPCPPKSPGICDSSNACAAALSPQECASSTQWAACVSKVTGAARSPGWPCPCRHRHTGPMGKQGGCRWHPSPKALLWPVPGCVGDLQRPRAAAWSRPQCALERLPAVRTARCLPATCEVTKHCEGALGSQDRVFCEYRGRSDAP